MCGIAGISTTAKRKPASKPVTAMLNALSHRGPDDDGLFLGKGIAIGHKRLSIVDLDGGRQPITAPGSGNVVAVNGMIYNYIELKAEFPDYNYQTRSDSEMALVLYEKHGPAFTQYLRGMYAIALYDKVKDQLILARDTYGIKPLYYAMSEKSLVFASEPQALIAAGLIDPAIKSEKAAELLQLKFVTGQQTIFDGIFRVLPGETLTIKNGEIIDRQRQDAFRADNPVRQNRSDAMVELDRLLMDTITTYVRSDVPYGVFLSGGVDSCTIVTAMAKAGVKTFPCYTARFPESGLHDETRTAEAVAKAAGTDHISLSITAGDFWNGLPELIDKIDDPSLDPAMMANFLLAKKAAKDVKVILGGDGGDEIFGGYRRYERALLPRFIKTKPLRKNGALSGSGLLKSDNNDWRDGFHRSELSALEKTHTRLQSFQATDGADFLPHFHLMKLDRCLMAHGIEGRTPLLDQRLAKFGFNLPDRLKLKRAKGKLLLREWLDYNMPVAQAFSRKRGFSTPVNLWIETRAPEFAEFVCRQDGVQQLFNIDAVRSVFQNPEGKAGQYLWPVFFYALWHERHIVGNRFSSIDDLNSVTH